MTNKYSSCQNYTAMKSTFLGILLQCGYRGWHVTGKITCSQKTISNTEDRNTEREALCVCEMAKNIQFLPKQALIDVCLWSGVF